MKKHLKIEKEKSFAQIHRKGLETLGIFFISLLIVGLFSLTVDSSLLAGKQSVAIPTLEPLPTYALTPTDSPTPVPQQTYQQNSSPLIDCTGPDGKHLEVTQQQCDSFNAAWGRYPQSNYFPSNYQNPNNSNQNNPSTVYQSYYNCMLYYPALNSYQTYNQLYTSKEQCDSAQSAINAGSNSPQNIYLPSPTPNTSAQLSECESQAMDIYNHALATCSPQNSLNSYSCGTQAQNTYNQNVANCHSQFGY